MTIVGGTILRTTGAGGAWASETTWTASGGGIFTNMANPYLIPSWQQGINMSANNGSTVYRNVPDVAAVADSIYIVWNGNGIGGVSGTSAASPMWAAFNALVNEQAGRLGKPPVGFINPVLYEIAKSPAYGSAFHDITTGNNLTPWNTQPGHENQYFAAAGYDLCTGWGTPAGMNLINALILYQGAVWVDFNYTGYYQNGLYDTPFKTLGPATAWVPTWGDIVIKTAGSTPEKPLLSRPMTIHAVGGPAIIGR